MEYGVDLDCGTGPREVAWGFSVERREGESLGFSHAKFKERRGGEERRGGGYAYAYAYTYTYDIFIDSW